MFTGIIQAVAPIISVSPVGECLRVRIKKPRGWKLKLGQSVSVDGVCSTVTKISPSMRSGRKSQSFFAVEYMPETLAKTTVKNFAHKTAVNLEQPLRLKDFVNGGLVQGHVDACGMVRAVVAKGKTRVLSITVPNTLMKYIASKGSITLSGVNLTVVGVSKNSFSVALIPYTLAHTNLALLGKGDCVNVEVDVLARSVVAALEHK